MAKYTFVTVSGVFEDETETVDILSRRDVERIAGTVAESALSSVEARLSRGLDRTSKMAAEAKKEAGAAKKAASAAEKGTESMAQRLAGEAGKTFRNVVEESLAPVFQTGLPEALNALKSIQKEHKALRAALAKLRKDLAATEKRLVGLEEENKRLREATGTPATEAAEEETEVSARKVPARKKKAVQACSVTPAKAGKSRTRKKDGGK